MVKRLCLAVLAICLVISQLGMMGLAAASETENFVGDYTLTGVGGADMIAIAMAQEGRTGKDFGYDDQWCAYFVSDCARIAGETGAIPAHGTCTYLYQNILSAGGTVSTQDPQPGDICFINWNGGSRMSHVEIVYQVEGGMVYTIGGNSGSESHYSTRCVKRHDPIDPACILAILRPNYGTQAAPVSPAPPNRNRPSRRRRQSRLLIRSSLMLPVVWVCPTPRPRPKGRHWCCRIRFPPMRDISSLVGVPLTTPFMPQAVCLLWIRMRYWWQVGQRKMLPMYSLWKYGPGRHRPGLIFYRLPMTPQGDTPIGFYTIKSK